jgi:hypothetical protein
MSWEKPSFPARASAKVFFLMQSRTAISRQRFTDYSWKIGVSFIYIFYIIIF